MAIQFSTARRPPARAEVVAHGLTVEAVSGDQALPSGLDRDALVSLGFTGQAGQVQVVPGDGRLMAAVGLGPVDGIDTVGVRRAAAALARSVRGRRTLAPDQATAARYDDL